MLRVISLLLILSAISGCSLFKEKIVVQHSNIYLPVICPTPAQPNPIIPVTVEPKVIKDQAEVAWIAMTPQHYENLSVNTQESISYIRDQNGVIQYYRSCIDDFNQRIEELKTEAEIPDAD